ncbi:MAG TPA: HAD-IB family hydrolase [Actinomycetota bacterium]|nr:HAD-IB family hydrolase [Actinomycetota bacterium]
MVESRPEGTSLVRRELAGKRVLLTGVTGFLGAGLLERILWDLPDTHVSVLVRPRFGSSGRERVREVLSGTAFARLREREGRDGLERLLDARVRVLEGDVAEDLPDLPSDLDVAIHCAASVSFDPPVDHAFRTNLLGTVRLYRALAEAGSRPHLVHVSTAYVAGTKKGVVPEAPLEHDVSWRDELEAALEARRSVEAASRKPEMLERFLERARGEHGRAGPQEVAAAAEELRREWVDRRLVQYGRARARSLGWPDVYTFTKALGERAAEEVAGEAGLPLSIVRPSIIESALRHPYPGWIEGFKMAEPIILAYGRGSIPEFPGIPEGVIDLIPVDFVVNAVLAAAARPPSPGTAAYYHVSSGARNPLSYRRLYQLVREYFLRHPLPERGRGSYLVPRWEFPGRRSVERRLRAGERLLEAADRVVSRLPRSERVRELVRRVDRERDRLEFVRRYADLYGAYVEMEVIYTDERCRRLFESLPEADRRDFPFDPTAIDWRHYLQDVHCPSVTRVVRAPLPSRPEPRVRVVPRQDGVVAVFDMEGTLVDSNVVESYLWLRMAELTPDGWLPELADLLRALPTYLAAERRDRGEFLRRFYRRYEGASVEGVRRLVREEVGDLLLQRLSPAAVRRVREHRRAGHRTVLITGALDVFVEPLAPLFDEVVSTRLAVEDGRYTGYLTRPPLVGEARAAWLRRYAAGSGADLRRSYAYADSHSDLPLLRAVGNPVAVNPDVALYRVARKRRWPVEDWRRVRGTPRVLVPEAMP